MQYRSHDHVACGMAYLMHPSSRAAASVLAYIQCSRPIQCKGLVSCLSTEHVVIELDQAIGAIGIKAIKGVVYYLLTTGLTGLNQYRP